MRRIFALVSRAALVVACIAVIPVGNAAALDYPTRSAAHLLSAIRPVAPPTSARGCFGRLVQRNVLASNSLSKTVLVPATIWAPMLSPRPHPTATPLFWQSRQRHQRLALQTSQFRIPARHRSGCRLHPRSERDGSTSCGSSQNRRRIYRLRESQPRQGQRRFLREWNVDSSIRRAIQNDDRDENARTCHTKVRRRC